MASRQCVKLVSNNFQLVYNVQSAVCSVQCAVCSLQYNADSEGGVRAATALPSPDFNWSGAAVAMVAGRAAVGELN